MTSVLPVLLSALPLATVVGSQLPSTPMPAEPPTPKTTEVLVILTAREGVTRPQIMAVMPAEIRATVKLYLDGTIRQWYSRGDGRGVIFLIDAKNTADALAIVDTMPLSKEHLVDHQFIPVGPLVPLAALLSR